jgi:peptide/bleomycin uptake transporter
MFVSFFPAPRLFFWSVALWSLFAILLWFFSAQYWGAAIGLENPPADAAPIIGVSVFWSKPFVWFYIYYAAAVALFSAFWKVYSPHPWFNWSVAGSALIVFVLYFNVEVSVAINNWYGSYFDLIQQALNKPGSVDISKLYSGLVDITGVLMTYIVVVVLLNFFTSHYIFRWRAAMNELYVNEWPNLRRVEGASQRVQEDTKRFAATTEDLGTSFVSAILTLIAFLPILAVLSKSVPEIPFLGKVPYSLVVVSLVWSIFGTGLLAIIGVRLPGLEFKNQRVEAAYRKELVYGEDDGDRAQPLHLFELFANVRQNYFRLYFNYLYFNIGRYSYLQADLLLPFLVLIPAIAAGAITFGIFTQVRSAFGEVRDAMQYLIKSWPDIIELISIYKRLRAFENTLTGTPVSSLEFTKDAA